MISDVLFLDTTLALAIFLQHFIFHGIFGSFKKKYLNIIRSIGLFDLTSLLAKFFKILVFEKSAQVSTIYLVKKIVTKCIDVPL